MFSNVSSHLISLLGVGMGVTHKLHDCVLVGSL